ncbi:aspartate aminotransferase family protein [Nocardiopsis alba]|uniref:aminotransferase family protein n=1 Tax=Nocardiopsis alba TaxID=53437 RepID=UPI00366B740B
MATHLSYLERGELIVEGEGVRVRDADGRWYLDARSGFWNVTLGYGHQGIIEAVRSQVTRLPYGSMWGYGRPTEIAVDYASALAEVLPEGIDHIRFQSNGAQAVETAVLLSRHLRLLEGRPHKNAVVGLWGGFHGFGPGASAITGLSYLHHHAGPLLPDVMHTRAPHGEEGDAATNMEGALRRLLDHGPDRISAVVVEPVIGEGGHVLTSEQAAALSAFCDEHEIHLVVDEVTTGMGRTGDYTRSARLGLRPDMLLLGKGITSGYAGLSAVCLSSEVYRALVEAPVERFFATGSTHDGHPLALAAGTAVLDALADGKVFAGTRARGATLAEGLRELSERHPAVSAVRGTGLMYAVEFSENAARDPWFVNKVRLALEERGVLVAVLNAVPSLMIIPPLVVDDADVEEILGGLDGALGDLASGWEPADETKGFV